MNETQYANYQVETSLSDVARALWRRKWIILLGTTSFLVGAYFLTQHMPKQWQAGAQLLLIQRAESGRVGAPDAAYTPPVNASIQTQIGMLETATMAERTITWLKTQAPSDIGSMNISDLQRSLVVSNPKESDLIDVSVLAPSRTQAILFTNAVALSFVQWKREQARKDVQATEVTLKAQTRDARSKMEAAMRKQLVYQKDHSIVDSASQARVEIDKLQQRDANVTSIQQELDGQQATANNLQNQLAQMNKSIQKNGPRDDAKTASIDAQLSQLQIQRDDLARQVTPAYPGKLPRLEAQIKYLQGLRDKAISSTQGSSNPSLQAQGALQMSIAQIQTQIATTQAKLTEALSLRNEAQQSMTPLVQTGSIYNQLARQAQEATTYYTGLQDALVSARLEENKINGDIQITQAAVASDTPAKPSLSMNLLIGGLIGLFVSLIAVFTIEQMDRRVRTEDQVERLGSGPILGALPRLSRASIGLLNRKQLPVPVAESYSLTGANLLRVLGSPQPGQGRIIMVTSAQPGEGKSLTAAELARSLARSGKRVILVDADMRHPIQNTLFDNAREEGLVEVLSGKALLDDALAVSETPNLSVLFNNAPRANSADIIVSPHMTSFLQMIRSRADIIVLDTPSCSVVDPLLLAPSVDYVLQVIDLCRSNEDAVSSTSSVLSGLAPLGLFINRTSNKNAPAYEVARSFAATVVRPGLPDSTKTSPFSTDHTLLMFRNTSGYTPSHLNGVTESLEGTGQESHDLTLPLKNREEH